MDEDRGRASWFIGRRLVCVAMMISGALYLDPFGSENPLEVLLAFIWFGCAIVWFVFPWLMRWGLGGYHGGLGGGSDS